MIRVQETIHMLSPSLAAVTGPFVGAVLSVPFAVDSLVSIVALDPLTGVLLGVTGPLIPGPWWVGVYSQLVATLDPDVLWSSPLPTVVSVTPAVPGSTVDAIGDVGLGLGPALEQVSIPLDVRSDLRDALDFPPWLGLVVTYTGLCTLLIGVLAWLSSAGYHRRSWGRRLAMSGVALTIVGFAFETFVQLLDYVLAG